MTSSPVVTRPSMPYPGAPIGATAVPADLAEWLKGILDGTVSTQPTHYKTRFVNGGLVFTPDGQYNMALPAGAVPEGAVVVYRRVLGTPQPPESSINLSMKDRLAALTTVTQKNVSQPALGLFSFEQVCYADRAALTRLASQAEANANALWDKAWNTGGFDAAYQAWKAGGSADPVLGAAGRKTLLAEQVSAVLRSQTNEVLRINGTMNDMNTVLKKLNGMAADAKNKGDTESITYDEGIAVGTAHVGGNAWAANVKPLWNAWGVDTSKFSVVTMANGQGRLVIEKRYIEVVIESLKIALDKASSEAQQKQLTLNNTLTQYNGRVEEVSALIQAFKNMAQATLPR